MEKQDKPCIIYEIFSPSTNLCYVGSTRRLLCQRKANHLSELRHNKCAITAKKVLEKDDRKFIILEKYPAETSKKDLLKLEMEMMKKQKANGKNVVNRNSDKTKDKAKYCRERYQTVEELREKKKKYYLNNKDSILEKAKIRYENKKIK